MSNCNGGRGLTLQMSLDLSGGRRCVKVTAHLEMSQLMDLKGAVHIKIMSSQTHQVHGAAHDSSHHSGHGPCYRGLERVDSPVRVDVTGGLDDGVRAEPHSIHKKLIDEPGHQTLLQAGQAVHFPDGVKSVKHVTVVDLVGAAALELSL